MEADRDKEKQEHARGAYLIACADETKLLRAAEAARQEAARARRATEDLRWAYIHTFPRGTPLAVVQSLPWRHLAWSDTEELRAGAGHSGEDIARELCALACILGTTTVVKFNGTPLRALPGAPYTDVLAEWYRARQAAHP